MVHVLGISASLRNARFSNDTLAAELRSVANQDALVQYLCQQSQFRLADFLEAGRAEGLSFNRIYDNLRKLRGERGFSNSEAALAASLWAALQESATISHCSLARHFPVHGKGHDLDELRQQILAADAIIMSGPVYFGDRGSLAQSLIEFIAADSVLKQLCRGKIYAGLAVGAKRNGGQETTLIYQMLDMVNLDFVAVGNGNGTTAQYGGTSVAGDVGRAHEDAYGIETSIGTGRRAAQAAQILQRGRELRVRLADPLRLHLWLLQDDKAQTGLALFRNWARKMSENRDDLDIRIFDVANGKVMRCIACDICPTHVGVKDEYRCIVTASDDFFVQNHEALISADAILLCAYCPTDRSAVNSLYQQFIERTRYLRRDNYVFSDILAAPFVISELNARQNLHLRMMTSIMRHDTIVHHPIIGMVHNGKILEEKRLHSISRAFIDAARETTIGRYLTRHRDDQVYNPVGYEISAHKAEQDRLTGEMGAAIQATARSKTESASSRIVSC